MEEKNNDFMTLFPFDVVRKSQEDFMVELGKCLQKKKDFLAHAPTGLGKTVAALSPCLQYAIEHEKTVFFLTSRHTQHQIALETLKKIKEKHDPDFNTTDIIGRKWMCPQPHVDKLTSSEFTDYCKSIRENGRCEFFTRTKQKNKLTVEAKNTISEIKNKICSTQEIVESCKKTGVCAYEISMAMAGKSEVIISDYNYIFEPMIRDLLFNKADKNLEDSIVIVDEAHNLPERLRRQASAKLSNVILKRAISEARKYRFNETVELLEILRKILDQLGQGLELGKERLVKKNVFTALVNHEMDYTQLVEDLDAIGNEIRERQKKSYLNSIAYFLDLWDKQPEEGFVRVVARERGKNEEMTVLSNNCLDPSIISKDIIKRAHSTILMSGTLIPTEMYADVLGFDDPVQKVYDNPFPEDNRLNIIVPKTTTKFTQRSDKQYRAIAQECAKITDKVPGNSIVFFPSYFLRDRVNIFFQSMSKKTIFTELPNMINTEKSDLLKRFKKYKKTGAVLLAVVSGNFYEGIDLPGDLLKGVVIVGLPLQQPDLQTKELINYYDKKFGKGWDYGYVFPAFNKTLQSAGRCIRSEKDKGIIVYLDERYAWPNYKRCFPKDIHFNITNEPAKMIEYFFKNI